MKNTKQAATLSLPQIEEREQQISELLQRLTAKSARPWLFGWAHGQHARLLNILGSPDDAVRKWRTAMPLLEKAIVMQPEDPTRGYEYAIWCTDLFWTLVNLGRDEEADEILRQATDALYESPRGLNYLAWRLACAPPQFRRPSKALELATRAVELTSDDRRVWKTKYLNTLGHAQYVCGDYEAAIESLTRSVELSACENGYNYVLLAMAHLQLGDQETSISCYQRASEWTVKNQLGDGQLRNHLAAAARLLGVEEDQTETRATVPEKYEIPILREDE